MLLNLPAPPCCANAQVSGMTLADYFRDRLDKYGLTQTLYDPTDGVTGIHKGQLPFPAYITYLQPGQSDAVADTAGVAVKQLAASAGSSSYWGGDVAGRNSTAVKTMNLAAGTAEAKQSIGQTRVRAGQRPTSQGVSVGVTAKYPGPSGLDWTFGNAAGSMVSTPQDMAKWFRALLVQSDHLGLGKELLREFLTLSTTVPGVPSWNVSSEGRSMNATLAFAQGLLVVKDPQHPRGLGVSNVYYLGSLGGFQATVYMWLHPKDASKDVFVNAVAATVLPDKNNWPDAAQNLTGSDCSAFAGTTSSSTVVGSAGRSSVGYAPGRGSTGGSNRRLLGALAVQSLGENAADALSMLCELSNMVPSVIKTVPDMLARKAFQVLMGREWFDIL